MAVFLLLYKTYHFLNSFNHNTYLLLLFHFLLVSLLLIYHTSKKNTETKSAPLFSFPSISQQNFPVPSLSSPLFSFPSLSKAKQPPLYAAGQQEIICDVKGPIFISQSPQANVVLESNKIEQQEITTISSLGPQEQASVQDTADNQSMDETWKAIVASGGAKPIKIKKIKSEKREQIKQEIIDW